MNWYGVGLPRSGTMMLSRVLGVVKESHHQCPSMRIDSRRYGFSYRDMWQDTLVGGVPDDKLRTYLDWVQRGHAIEVAYWLSGLAPNLDGRVICLWRDANSWTSAAIRRGMLSGMEPGVNKTLTDGHVDRWPGETPEEKVANIWLLGVEKMLNREDAFFTTAADLDIPKLVDWLGIEVAPSTLIAMETIKGMKLNADPSPNEVPPITVPGSKELELELERRSYDN